MSDHTTSDWAIARMVREWVARKPDHACLISEGTTRTWREVYDRTSRLAQGLLEFGLSPQDRIMYLGKNRPEFFEIVIGSSMCGVVPSALNWRLAPPEMRQIIDHSQARVLFLEHEFLEHLEKIRPQLTSVERVVVIDSPTGSDGYEAWLDSHVPEDPHTDVGETDPAFQMYTSGTTGLPKGAVFSNASVRAALQYGDLVAVDEDAVVLIAMPVFHASGAACGLQALGLGATCVLARDFSAETLLSLIETHRVTTVPLVPVALKMLLEHPQFDAHDLSSLEAVSYMGSPITQEVLLEALRRLNCRILQLYGLTETNLATALATEDHTDPQHPERRLSAGRAVPGSSVRVVDPVSGLDEAEGEFGEVWIRSPTQMAEYWNAPAETAATITADGYVRTGDGGYLRDGYLYLRDRIKDMVVSGGENVYPVEVENVLITHPAVNDVAVIGVPSDRWGETVKAVVVLSSSAPPTDAADLIAYARQHLAGYKCPTSVEFVTDLPRNPSGKILKRVLRESFAG